MFKINDEVLEVGTGIKGKIVDIDITDEKPYGVLFEDVDEDNGVWWCNENEIELYNINNQ